MTTTSTCLGSVKKALYLKSSMSNGEIDKSIWKQRTGRVKAETESCSQMWGLLANNERSVPIEGWKSINSVYTSVIRMDGPYFLCSDELCTVSTHVHLHKHNLTEWCKLGYTVHTKPIIKQMKSTTCSAIRVATTICILFKRKLGGQRTSYLLIVLQSFPLCPQH